MSKNPARIERERFQVEAETDVSNNSLATKATVAVGMAIAGVTSGHAAPPPAPDLSAVETGVAAVLVTLLAIAVAVGAYRIYRSVVGR